MALHWVGMSRLVEDTSPNDAAPGATATAPRTTDRLNEDAFARSIAHDLRAPLTAIHGFVSLVLRGENLTGEQRQDLNRVLAAAERMDTHLRHLLTLVRLTQADLPLAPVDLRAVVQNVLSDMHPLIQEGGARVTVDEALPTVRGNAVVLHQVLLNLIENAMKFVRAGERPEVRVSARVDGGFVRVSVEDRGIGMRAADLTRIFWMFERLHRPEDYPGNGLGLAVVKEGVERLGGEVGVTSTPAVGSRFWFTLPEPA